MSGRFFERARVIIKRDWRSVPNILCYLRILAIPVFMWLYLVMDRWTVSSVIIVASWLTDVADGFIARRFDQATEFGKALDPVADKLTQIAVFACLAGRFRSVMIFAVVLTVKEALMFIVGVLMFRRLNRVNQARWYGKAVTFAVIASAVALVLLPNMSEGTVDALMAADCALVAASFLLYLVRYIRMELDAKRGYNGDNEGKGGDTA